MWAVSYSEFETKGSDRVSDRSRPAWVEEGVLGAETALSPVFAVPGVGLHIPILEGVAQNGGAP